jgi:hypothetical protein
VVVNNNRNNTDSCVVTTGALQAYGTMLSIGAYKPTDAGNDGKSLGSNLMKHLPTPVKNVVDMWRGIMSNESPSWVGFNILFCFD